MLSEVRYSNLSLAPRTKRKGKPISDRAFAAIEFEAWEPVNGGEPSPSKEMMDRITIQSRLAYLTMLKSKDELIAMHREMDLETHDEMLTGLEDTAERLKEMASLVEQAIHRMLVAGTAYVKGA
jgi:hypothetical protein